MRAKLGTLGCKTGLGECRAVKHHNPQGRKTPALPLVATADRRGNQGGKNKIIKKNLTGCERVYREACRAMSLL